MAEKNNNNRGRSNELRNLLTTDCGFAPPNPLREDRINEGSAIILVYNNGTYDVICSYYNETCRKNCQILRTIVNSNQNKDIPNSPPLKDIIPKDSIDFVVDFESDDDKGDNFDEEPDFDDDEEL